MQGEPVPAYLREPAGIPIPQVPMTERKPLGISFETFVERQIREAQERGEFDDLPGKGKPLPGLDKPYDEMWWVKSLVEREKLSVLPPTLELQRDIERGLESAMKLKSERSVRKAIKLLNIKIARANRRASDGPPTSLALLNTERVVARWRHDKAR